MVLYVDQMKSKEEYILFYLIPEAWVQIWLTVLLFAGFYFLSQSLHVLQKYKHHKMFCNEIANAYFCLILFS